MTTTLIPRALLNGGATLIHAAGGWAMTLPAANPQEVSVLGTEGRALLVRCGDSSVFLAYPEDVAARWTAKVCSAVGGCEAPAMRHSILCAQHVMAAAL